MANEKTGGVPRVAPYNGDEDDIFVSCSRRTMTHKEATEGPVYLSALWPDF